MRTSLEAAAENYNIYDIRRQQFITEQKIPFRVAPTPFTLSAAQKHELTELGPDLTNYFNAVDELYRHDTVVRNLLDTGKPQIFLDDQPSHYLFIRPDIIITPAGFSVCEIETSPFGLALAAILNQAYGNAGFETLVAGDRLVNYVQSQTPIKGQIVYSRKTQSFSGQMAFLADKIFSGNGRKWEATPADDFVQTGKQTSLYRGFYLSEYLSDPDVALLLQKQMAAKSTILPSPTPHLEEKAILALIWDKRFAPYFRKNLGDAVFKHLCQVIPPTWIVGQEKFFIPGLPDNISSSVDLAGLSKSKRAFVLKPSGFGQQGSWSEGVHFLHKESVAKTQKLLYAALKDSSQLYVIQAFRKGANFPMEYEEENKQSHISISARVRLTPYFAIEGNQLGKLIAIKATACAKTDLIHASTSSINIAVN